MNGMGASRLLKRCLYRVAKAPGVGGLLVRLLPSHVLWKHLSQAGELEFHRGNVWRASDGFKVATEKLFEWMGLEPTDFTGEVVIDVGAGSRLRSAFFEEARVVAIEPLADKFRAEIPWCDLDEADRVYSIPAEEFVDELEGRAGGVISINVLDHCFAFERIIGNIYRYLKPGGVAILSFDSHEVADAMHPLVLTEEKCSSLFRRVGFELLECRHGLGPTKDSYGHGESLTYRLRKPETKTESLAG